MNQTRWWLCTVAVASMCGCSGGAKEPPSPDQPIADAKNKDLQLNQRIKALEQTWAGAKDDPARLPAARDAMKDVLWKGGAPSPLRQRALALLLEDESAAGMADTRNMLRLRMPTEGQWQVLVEMCEAVQKRAGDAAWKEMTAALVRSYARKVPVPPDPDRPERVALVALYPNTDLTAVVYEVFVQPRENGAPARPDDYVEKARTAAWDLLGRLDPDGSKRTALIAADNRDEAALRELTKSARELGVTPLTGSELSWLRNVSNAKDAKNAAWWGETVKAIAALTPEQKTGLAFRHLEAVRWAAAHNSEWSRASKEALFAELSGRLKDRKMWRKADPSDTGQVPRETLKDWQGELAWGDLLVMLVLDDALREPAIRAELFRQAESDMADESTEHGGAMWAKEQVPTAVIATSGKDASRDAGAGIGEQFVVRGFPPRPAQRVNDRTFVASDEMFQQSGRALAHYHFHVQTSNNADYAGPGRGDFEYADMHGRSCLVLTSVRKGVLNIDYYQRGGAVVDLGEIVEGK